MKRNRIEDEDIDGCDIDFTAEEQTNDADLPEASGGVGGADEELDGCDINFAAEVEAADEDLPLSTGGVG